MKRDINGCSQCQNGQEWHEVFYHRNKLFVEYEYRTPEGKLFSCVAKSLEDARHKKEQWIINN